MQNHRDYVDLATDEWPGGSATVSFLAVYSSGHALIVHDQAHNSEVRKLLKLVETRWDLTLEREYVQLEDIANARRDGLAGRRGDADRGMQASILDLIEAAHNLKSSDIHIGVDEKITTVSMRVDGLLKPHTTWTADFGLRLLGASYAMADIANKSYSPARFLSARLAPRQGRDDWNFPAGLEAVRMQFNPKAFGQNYAVLRLLDTIQNHTTLEQLGYEEDQLPTLRNFARRYKGLCIISGPTGSGKSTSVCTLLMRQRETEAAEGRARSCFTIEDPPERRLPGAQQLVVPNTDTDEARHGAFADTIKAALRSDPEILLIGEIRDQITALLTLQASMTGHQVYSTLHCSTAHAIPMRLIDLGADPTIILSGDELQVAVAQILAAKLCPHCKVPLRDDHNNPDLKLLLRAIPQGGFVAGKGCSECRNTGVKGRTVLAEVIRTDADYLSVLKDKGIFAAREFTRARGEPSIEDIAIRKAARGDISCNVLPEIMDLSTLANPIVALAEAG
ncbi:GspE/PulE family protein [Novosphingobium terrae]|uniref:GspE/PulE family protein n=1 Tax=Novosphingobium terrae TaxID=2726189 RepID=UPI00197E778A|nr:ATPase, T2SS/T4P/T4SS family [Novosphingobium terrae]